jgi:hypothetical protein
MKNQNNQLVEFLENINNGRSTHALTLTFKRYNSSLAQFLSREVAEHTVRWLISRINRMCFGNRAKRAGFSIGVVTAIHNGSSTLHIHAHLTISSPPWMQYEEFTKLLEEAISRSHWINFQYDIKPYRDKFWLQYCLNEGPEAFAPLCTFQPHP